MILTVACKKFIKNRRPKQGVVETLHATSLQIFKSLFWLIE